MCVSIQPLNRIGLFQFMSIKIGFNVEVCSKGDIIGTIGRRFNRRTRIGEIDRRMGRLKYMAEYPHKESWYIKNGWDRLMLDDNLWPEPGDPMLTVKNYNQMVENFKAEGYVQLSIYAMYEQHEEPLYILYGKKEVDTHCCPHCKKEI